MSTSSCSKTCGTGTQLIGRYKTITENYGGSCSGVSTGAVDCNTHCCPGKEIVIIKIRSIVLTKL